jgi:osmotically-inducible protein OsmY
MRSDNDIKQDVESELKWNPVLNTTDVAVAVRDGVVTLAGFVRSYGAKREAERTAKRVAGVVGLANDIVVRLPLLSVRPDPDIAHDAVAAIKNQLPDNWEQIRVVVRDGRITLEGEVDWQLKRELAESAVRWLRGVKEVTNAIEIKPRVKPEEIKHKIEEALLRNAEIDANRITVDVNGDEIILKGAVRSWAEREEAERVAWAAPGVTKVEDRLSLA